MKVLIYPHSMELGGSQLNAVDLAGALQRAGHEVLVYGERGALESRIAHWGLEHVVPRASHTSPDLGRAAELRRLARHRQIEVLHGWEWPPILECWTAALTARGPASTVGSIMSMSVAPFLPDTVPLTVGTENILRQTPRRSRDAPVSLLEPPVDLDDNLPGGHKDSRLVRSDAELRLAIVSRLVPELKLEGILTAVAATHRLAERFPCRLLIAGDGPAGEEVRAAAEKANASLGREVVTLLGAVDDPRSVYDEAHVCLGMGGSALRSLAFAKPLVVQGERGFFMTLTPESRDNFLRDGWYGVADRSSDAAVDHLVAELEPLLADPARRDLLGTFGQNLVRERFSLVAGVRTLEGIYRQAVSAPGCRTRDLAAALRSGRRLLSYKVERQRQRRRGSFSVDDFNARPA